MRDGELVWIGVLLGLGWAWVCWRSAAVNTAKGRVCGHCASTRIEPVVDPSHPDVSKWCNNCRRLS